MKLIEELFLDKEPANYPSLSVQAGSQVMNERPVARFGKRVRDTIPRDTIPRYS